MVSVRATGIEGVAVVTGTTHGDERGFFREHFRRSELEAVVGPVRFAQGNHSRSRPGVLRGFHLEPWDKLVHVVRGTALVVVADPRPGSPTFGRCESFLLGDEPGSFARIFVREGLANAVYALTEVDYLNDVSAEYRPEGRGGIAWDDPDLAVEWPSPTPTLSAADRGWPTLRELRPAGFARAQSSGVQ